MKKVLLGTVAAWVGLCNGAFADDGVQPETVVVTAQRRLQSVDDVPISVRVVSGDELAARGTQNVQEAFDSTANVQFNLLGDGADGAGIAVRGVSAAGVFGVDQAIPIYVDGVLLGSESSFNPSMYDIARMEILRGPQGTLYGRDALGGAVSIVTVKPDLSGTSGYLEGMGGSYGERGGRGTINLALDDSSAVRLSAYGLGSDGYVTNTFGGNKYQNRNEYGAQAQWLYRPFLDWEFVLRADYSRNGGRYYGIGDRNTVPQTLSVSIALPFQGHSQSYGTSLDSTWHGENFDVESITAWRGATAIGGGGNFTASPLLQQGYERQYNQGSEEIRLVSHPGGPLDWVAGFYAFGYTEQRVDYYGFNQALPANSFFPGQPPLGAGYRESSVPHIGTQNYAGFGDLTYHTTDRLDLIAGARVSYDLRDIHYDHHSNYPAPGFSFFAPTQVLDQSRDAATFTPRVGALFKADDNLNFYATISRGYKSGGFNPSFAASSDLYYRPESGWNYEVGLKGWGFGHAVDYSLSAFDFEWSNKQAYYYNGFFITIANARGSRSYGGEGAVNWHLTDSFQLGAQLGWLNASFTDFPNAGDSTSGAAVNATGFRLPLAPHLTSNLSAQYAVAVGSAGKFTARLDYNYRSRFYFDVLQQSPQSGYGLLNATLSYAIPDWTVWLYARNLSDQRYLSYAYTTTQGLPGEPRTFELAVRRSF